MIHNSRNRSNDTTESQKEIKTCFNAHFQKSVKNHITKITYASKFVLMSCPGHFVLMFCGTANPALLLACFYFFCQNQGFFFSYKIVLIKKRLYIMYKN